MLWFSMKKIFTIQATEYITYIFAPAPFQLFDNDNDNENNFIVM